MSAVKVCTPIYVGLLDRYNLEGSFLFVKIPKLITIFDMFLN